MILRRCFSIICLVAFLFVNQAIAQFTTKIGGVNYVVPVFNTDTLTNAEAYIPEDSLLQVNHFIKPIKSSKYDFEVRCFYKESSGIDHFRMIILKGTKGKLQVEEYYLSHVYIVVNGGNKIKAPSGIGEIAITNNNYSISNKDSTFAKLLNLGLFSNAGQHVYSELKEGSFNKDDLKFLQGKIIFEVKLDNYYHSFSYKINRLPHSIIIEADGDGKKLFEVFNNLIAKERKI